MYRLSFLYKREKEERKRCCVCLLSFTCRTWGQHHNVNLYRNLVHRYRTFTISQHSNETAPIEFYLLFVNEIKENPNNFMNHLWLFRRIYIIIIELIVHYFLFSFVGYTRAHVSSFISHIKWLLLSFCSVGKEERSNGYYFSIIVLLFRVSKNAHSLDVICGKPHTT